MLYYSFGPVRVRTRGRKTRQHRTRHPAMPVSTLRQFGIKVNSVYGNYMMSSNQSDPKPNKKPLTRKQCCKCMMEPLICRCLLSLFRIILRVRVALFASDNYVVHLYNMFYMCL